MKVKYLGDAPGQAPVISIGGKKFERGKTYDLRKELAERLIQRGGFESEDVDNSTDNIEKEID